MLHEPLKLRPVHDTVSDPCPFTNKERTVVQMLTNGMGKAEIAHCLDTEYSVIARRIRSCKAKAGVHGGDAGLVVLALRRGWVTLPAGRTASLNSDQNP